MVPDNHPLFRRLTGQAVWCLLEESGLAPERVDGFMDAYQHWREANLKRLAPLLDPSSPLPPALRFTASGEDWRLPPGVPQPLPCPRCVALNGRLMAISAQTLPDVLLRLPPYSLGCRLSAIPIWAPVHGSPSPAPTSSFPVSPDLLCPSDWFLHTPWERLP